MTRFLYYDDIFRPKREQFVPEFSILTLCAENFVKQVVKRQTKTIDHLYTN